jgi:hypothetical protein
MTKQDTESLLKDRDLLLEALDNIEQALAVDLDTFAIDDVNLDVEKCVQTYLILRESREQLKDRFERRDKSFVRAQDHIEAVLHVHIDRTNVKGLNTRFGSVFQSPQSTARIADREAFLSFVQENNAWHLVTLGANKATVGDHLAEHDGVLPPGVDWSSRIKVQIRRK